VQETLTRRSSWLTLVAKCECLKRHGVGDGVGERESEVGADFGSPVSPRNPYTYIEGASVNYNRHTSLHLHFSVRQL